MDLLGFLRRPSPPPDTTPDDGERAVPGAPADAGVDPLDSVAFSGVALGGAYASSGGIPAPPESGESNNIVLAVSSWRARFLAGCGILARDPSGAATPHPVLDVFRQPNSRTTGGEFWRRAILDYDTSGNAFWFKLRPSAGAAPIGLQRLDPRRITVERDRQGVVRYRLDNGRRLAAEDVVHWKHIPSRDGLVGYSPVWTLWSELAADREAASAYYWILRNAGVVGFVVSLSSEGAATATLEEVQEVNRILEAQTTGAGRGRPLLLGSTLIRAVQEIRGVSDRLNYKHINDRAEERVCMSFGVPPQVLGAGAGVETPQWGSTVASLQMQAITNGGIPLVRSLLDTLNCYLLPEYGTPGVMLAADYGGIPEIGLAREEALDRWLARLLTLVSSGVYTPEEVRPLIADPHAAGVPEALRPPALEHLL